MEDHFDEQFEEKDSMKGSTYPQSSSLASLSCLNTYITTELDLRLALYETRSWVRIQHEFK